MHQRSAYLKVHVQVYVATYVILKLYERGFQNSSCSLSLAQSPHCQPQSCVIAYCSWTAINADSQIDKYLLCEAVFGTPESPCIPSSPTTYQNHPHHVVRRCLQCLPRPGQPGHRCQHGFRKVGIQPAKNYGYRYPDRVAKCRPILHI